MLTVLTLSSRSRCHLAFTAAPRALSRKRATYVHGGTEQWLADGIIADDDLAKTGNKPS